MDASVFEANTSHIQRVLAERYAPFPPPTEATREYAEAVYTFLEEIGARASGVIVVAVVPAGRRGVRVLVSLSAALMRNANALIGGPGNGGYNGIRASMEADIKKKFKGVAGLTLSTRLLEGMELVCKASCAEPKIIASAVLKAEYMTSFCIIGFGQGLSSYETIGDSSGTLYLEPCQECKNFGRLFARHLTEPRNGDL
ncbi:hypothetical protein [Paraburkholderia mimosarum]|uniref:hypothetical protein n=1 Tax=Paraburkholderia mimosarum TaxID=312026 RepID=UPI0012DFDC9E|nr:hypothetical protein [Paraburkholderia mimosarum]